MTAGSVRRRRRARRCRAVFAATIVAVGCGPDGGTPDEESGPAEAASGVDPESAAVFRLVEVTDGVWALPVQPDRNPSQFAASVIVVRDDHVLVVDSRHSPTSGRSLIARVRGITDLPVRYLVNTHWHGDHVRGNGAFVEAFPDIRIIGGETIDEDMMTLGRARLEEEGADIELVPPAVLVEDELVLDDAEPVVRILRVGPAHTRGDVVVHLPSLDILIAGDLIEDGFPWHGDGYPSGWADALDRLSGLDARILLPSHGPVLRDSDMLETQRVFMRLLVEEARAAFERGEGPESIQENAAFSGFEDHFTRRLTGYTLRGRQERYDAFLAEAFERAWREAAGELDAGR